MHTSFNIIQYIISCQHICSFVFLKIKNVSLFSRKCIYLYIDSFNYITRQILFLCYHILLMLTSSLTFAFLCTVHFFIYFFYNFHTMNVLMSCLICNGHQWHTNIVNKQIDVRSLRVLVSCGPSNFIVFTVLCVLALVDE